MSRQRGTVKWFNDTKGYGFITGDDGVDVFVHYSGINGNGHRSLEDGQEVEFTLTHTVRGLQANDVTVID